MDENAIMTPEVFLEEMKSIRARFGEDYECLHDAMDITMCKLLESLGYGEGIEVFRNAPKWYA